MLYSAGHDALYWAKKPACLICPLHAACTCDLNVIMEGCSFSALKLVEQAVYEDSVQQLSPVLQPTQLQ